MSVRLNEQVLGAVGEDRTIRGSSAQGTVTWGDSGKAPMKEEGSVHSSLRPAAHTPGTHPRACSLSWQVRGVILFKERKKEKKKPSYFPYI